MAGVELVLSHFHTAAVDVLSKQSSLKSAENFCIPMTENFQTKMSAVTAAWHERRRNEY